MFAFVVCTLSCFASCYLGYLYGSIPNKIYPLPGQVWKVKGIGRVGVRSVEHKSRQIRYSLKSSKEKKSLSKESFVGDLGSFLKYGTLIEYATWEIESDD